MNNLKSYNVGDTVMTKRGEGVVVEKTFTIHDGDVYKIRLNTDEYIDRTYKGMSLVREGKHA